MGYWANKVASYGNAKHIAQEAIRFQDRTKLEILASAVAEFRNVGLFEPLDYKNSKIVKVLYDMFGVTIEFDNGSAFGIPNAIYAGVLPPVMDNNCPIINETRKLASANKVRMEDFTRLSRKNEIGGYIDYKNAKLGEDFSKLSSLLVVSRGLMIDTKYSDTEIAAIICHEVGHIFSYFSSIIQTSIGNILARSVADELLETSDEKTRVRIVKNFSGLTGIDQANLETVLETKSKDVIYIHLCTEMNISRVNLSGSKSIANRNWERASDEFVGRLGGSEYLVTALMKMNEEVPAIFREKGLISMPLHLSIETSKVMFWLASAVFVPFATGFLTAFILLNNFGDSEYDPIEERFVTLKNQLKGELRVVENVKGANANATRQRILSDLSSVEDILKNINDKDTIGDLLVLMLSPAARRDRKATEYNKHIESLLNNDLIVSANKLSLRV